MMINSRASLIPVLRRKCPALLNDFGRRDVPEARSKNAGGGHGASGGGDGDLGNAAGAGRLPGPAGGRAEAVREPPPPPPAHHPGEGPPAVSPPPRNPAPA